MTVKVALITGASQGLGYETARHLAASGQIHVIIGSRVFERAQEAVNKLNGVDRAPAYPGSFEPIEIDVTSDTSIQAAVNHVKSKHGKLDMLLNNAGITTDHEIKDHAVLRETYRRLYDTNLFGAVMVTEMFLPLLRLGTSKRIAFTSSGLGSLQWASQSQDIMNAINLPIYRSTKTALNMIMLHFARLLEPQGFIVSAADPGYCSTNLTGFLAGRAPAEGAQVLIKALQGNKEAVHGAVISDLGKEPW
ncbi:NAD(P)-binding protein [Hortaea werneckii]|nr:NAD(P)-binding protein [Hortaea werneckii]